MFVVSYNVASASMETLAVAGEVKVKIRQWTNALQVNIQNFAQSSSPADSGTRAGSASSSLNSDHVSYVGPMVIGLLGVLLSGFDVAASMSARSNEKNSS
jgi:hypothetical protein